jgi:hypothetical protein
MAARFPLSHLVRALLVQITFLLEFRRGDSTRYLFHWTAAQWTSTSVITRFLILMLVLWLHDWGDFAETVAAEKSGLQKTPPVYVFETDGVHFWH